MRGAGAALGVVLAVASLAGSVQAVEREHHLGVDVGGAMLVINDKSTADVGASAGVHYTYGLSDQFNLMLDTSWSLLALGHTLDNPDTPHTRPSNLTTADVGLGYVLDILQWVPWGGVLVGGYALDGGTIDGVKILPGAAAALGLDYRVSRSWVAGVSARQHLLFTQASTYPSFTQVFARLEYTWGW